MKPSNVALALSALQRKRRPGFVWGPPGVGKSVIVRKVADDLGIELVDVRAVLLDPVDLRGLPHVNGDGRSAWCPPEFLPHDPGSSGILFLDELPQAPPLVQNACLQLALDRKIGEYTLPDGWTVFAAGNRETDRAHTTRLSSALANRFVHLYFDVDLDEWCKWAIAKGLRIETIAFLRYRPELLHKFDPQQKAFPTPRSWEFADSLVDAVNVATVETDLLAGCIGEAAALEYYGFLKVFRQLPSVDAAMMDPENTPLPDEPAACYAMAGAMARRVDDSNFDRALTYIGRMAPEFSVVLVRDGVARCPDVQRTAAYIHWASVNSSIMI